MRVQPTNRMRIMFRQTVLFVVGLHVSGGAALAGIEGAAVVHGSAQFERSGNYTAIQASDKAIINYRSFDIARPETVEFIQPGASASVLNRILSANPTTIDGTILANGRVFFVNPAGVIFGGSAQVNVAQLVASALDISNTDFINGRYDFRGGDGSVINNGRISAERAYLIGKRVANLGKIDCPGGYVVMAAGDRVFLGEPGTDLLVEMDESALANQSAPIEGAAVLNEGSVDVAGGSIVLAAAGDVYAHAISNVGRLSAAAASGDGGTVKLAAPEGTVINTGSIEAVSESGKGGEVQMLGNRVGLFGSGRIDASGATGGGSIRVGGDYKGQGEVPTASRTSIGTDASIRADATADGDGGKIIVWSDEVTQFYGHASTTGAGGGNGGLIEVSGKQDLNFAGTVAMGSPGGRGGTLLLDPGTITITDGGQDDSPQDDLAFGDPPFQATISEMTLENTASGSNAEIVLEATNDIVIDDLGDDALMLSDGVSLVLRTRNNPALEENPDGGITMNQGDSIVASGGGGITLQAGHDGQGFVANSVAHVVAGSLVTDGGSVTVQATGDVFVEDVTTAGAANRGGGSVVLEAGRLTASHDLVVGGTINASGGPDADATGANPAGSVTLTGGTVYVHDIVTVGGDDNGGNAQGGAGGSVILGAPVEIVSLGSSIRTSGGDGSSVGDGGDVTFNGPLVLDGDVTITAGSGNAAFQGSVDAMYGEGGPVSASLVVNSAGTTRFESPVGQQYPIDSLTTDATGTTEINADITTGGTAGLPATQTYNDPVVLTNNATLTDHGTTGIFFNSTVGGDGEGPWNLRVETTAGAAEVQFNDAVTFGGGLWVQTAGGNVTFQGTVDGEGYGTDSILSIYSAGTTRFNAAVGGIDPIGQVFTDEAGTTEINANITTGGTQLFATQTYDDPVVLTDSVTLTDAGMDGISFNSTVAGDGEGPWDLTVVTTDPAAEIQFNDTVNLDGGLAATAAGDIQANSLLSASHNISLRSTGGDLNLHGTVNADRDADGNGGGVSLISESGMVQSGDGFLDVTIIGYSDGELGVDLPYQPGGKTAILIDSDEPLHLVSYDSLIARGQYEVSYEPFTPGTDEGAWWARDLEGGSFHYASGLVDDRSAVGLSDDWYYGGVPIDVAIYLRSRSSGVTLDSPVTVPDGATVVLDAYDTLGFGGAFIEGSSFPDTSRLELVSRVTTTLGTEADRSRFPYPVSYLGHEVEENQGPAWFAGYSSVLRGGSVAEFLATMEYWYSYAPESAPVVPPLPVIIVPHVVPPIPIYAFISPDWMSLAEGIVGPIVPAHPECMDVKEEDVEILRKCQVACDLFSTDVSLNVVAQDIVTLDSRLKAQIQEILPRLDSLSQRWPRVRQGDMPAIEQALKQDTVLSSWLQDGVEFVKLLRTKLGRTTNDSVERFLLQYLASATDESVLDFVQTYLKSKLALTAGAGERVAQAG